MKVYFVLGENTTLPTYFGRYLLLLGNCHCFKYPNNEHIIWPSGHTGCDANKLPLAYVLIKDFTWSGAVPSRLVQMTRWMWHLSRSNMYISKMDAFVIRFLPCYQVKLFLALLQPILTLDFLGNCKWLLKETLISMTTWAVMSMTLYHSEERVRYWPN